VAGHEVRVERGPDPEPAALSTCEPAAGPVAGPAAGGGDADVDALFLDFCLSDSDYGRDTVAARLAEHPDLDRLVSERKEVAESRHHVFRLVRHLVTMSVARHEDWTALAVTWLLRLDASWSESADVCNKLCLRSRRLLNSPRPYLSTDDLNGSLAGTADGRAMLHLYATALRYEFRCRSLEGFLESLGVPVASLDPYLHALYAYALLAQNDPRGVEELHAVLARGGGDDISVLHALQEGLRYGYDIPDQAELMLTLWRRPDRGDRRDATVLLREAYALRRLGRYDEALATVNRSLLQLQPNEVDRQERRISERWRIIEQREIAQRIEREYAKAHRTARAEIEEMTRRMLAQLDEQVAGVRSQVSNSLFRIVEILGIFTAVIALVVGGAAAGNAGGGVTWWQRALLIVVSGAVAIGFFVLLRVVVGTGQDGSRRERLPAPGGTGVSPPETTSGRGSRT
jgi:tetratricopeptide (TPR) repeat protein